jgi:hypothetical protein
MLVGVEEGPRLVQRAVAAAHQRHGDRLGELEALHQRPHLAVVEGLELELACDRIRHAARLASGPDGTGGTSYAGSGSSSERSPKK